MRYLFIIAMALSGSSMACTPSKIEEVATLVLQANPVILAERQELAEQSRQRDWSAKLTFGYPVGGTDSVTATTPNVGIQVEIPLFDRASELRVVKARSVFQQRQDGVLSDFLGELEKFCSKRDQVLELDSARNFYRDRLRYRQEQVKEGIEEADVLWKETEKAQKVEHDYRRVHGELISMQLAIARRFGGDEWKRLRALLAEAIR